MRAAASATGQARAAAGKRLMHNATAAGQHDRAFRALIVHPKEAKDVPPRHQVTEVRSLDDLPAERQLTAGDRTTVRIQFSTLNYKDGMVLQGQPGVAKSFPIVPGIDFVGTVESCETGKWQPGQQVLLTGNYAGQHIHGAYAELCRVPAEWLVPKPDSLSPEETMLIGTAGFTAMQSIIWLERAGKLKPDSTLLVTGASGGVGSTAVAIAHHLGYKNIVASTGRVEKNQQLLRKLGATEVIGRLEAGRPLDAERYDAAIDTVGGSTLAAVLSQLKYGGAVACSGVAGGPKVPASVFPFILRGVSLLGVDSVQLPQAERLAVWDRLARDFPRSYFGLVRNDPVQLEALGPLSQQILAGQVTGRVLVDVRSKL